MSAVDVFEEQFPLVVPARATTHAGFRQWLIEERVDKPGLICFFDGDLFIDISPEEIGTHNALRLEVDYCIIGLNKQRKMGVYYGRGALLTNVEAGLSTEPDGVFVREETFESGRVTRVRQPTGEVMELLGSPDWVLEIVSRTTVRKDTITLPRLYHRARIGEYWLISALDGGIDFRILRWQEAGYKRVPVRDGWQRSPLFGCWFRLTREEDRMGYWEYTLEVRE